MIDKQANTFDIEKFREEIKTPEGTLAFTYISKELLNPDMSDLVIFNETTGNHIFRLERTNDLLLKFYYSTTSTGTKVAEIDLSKSPSCERFKIIFTWSPTEINLYLGPMIEGGKLQHSTGKVSDFLLQKDKKGDVNQIGDKGIEIMNFNVYENGTKILTPSAINSWEDTKKAVEILNTGESKLGYIHEVILSNIAISTLATGFEVYAKKRLLELENEGIIPNTENYLSKFNEKQQTQFREQAMDKKISLLENLIANKKINLLNYDECKEAYNKIFNMNLNSIGLSNIELEKVQDFIKFRHQIIHVSLFSEIFNQPQIPKEGPIFSNKALAIEAVDIFDSFINKLHEATLNKRN